MSGIVATIISFVALPLGIVGWAIPYWEYHGNFMGQVHIGLWEYCARLHGAFGYSYNCVKLESVWSITPSMNAVRALVILGSIMQCFALVCSIMKLCVKKELQALFKAAGGFALFSALLMIIAVIVFAAKTRQETEYVISRFIKHFDLHAGFGLCIVSGGLAIIAGILYILDKRRQPPPHSYMTAQPGTMPMQVVYPVTGYSAGYSAGFSPGAPGVVLSPPPYYSNPPVNSGGHTDVKSPPPPYQPL